TGDYWRRLFSHSWDILAPFAVGGLLLSVVCSLAAYPLTLRMLRAKQRFRMNAKGLNKGD
ncbi:MAG: DUF2062 domain-containing protein, partial [Acidobacteria bacterium]|nr:DUF2062 domain-containing protein [Acidobacteriota bacterium]